MKNILITIMLCIVYISNAQTLSYNDLGVLFSRENINGTARYNAMGGAFGGLGGDISAIESNPAGAAVFLKSEFSFTLSIKNLDTKATYYGNSTEYGYDHTDVAQSGGVFVFRNNATNSEWGKMAFAFNYTQQNDFRNYWEASGNSNYPTWNTDPYDETREYNFSDGQVFQNYTNGRNNRYSFTFGSQYDENLFLGASFVFYNMSYYQDTFLQEFNNDGSGNVLEATMYQELFTVGDGFSFNLGIIGKPTDNLRLGLSYQSPVWYDFFESYIPFDIEVYISEFDDYFYEPEELKYGENYYSMKTPGKFIGSIAYIFNKSGLFSLDYIYKNYKNINLRNSNFTEENKAFGEQLKGVSEVRVGTEWRIDNFSLRGGYHFEQSPYKNSISSDDLTGYSLGLGYKFRKARFDFAYQNSSRTAPYDFYPEYDEVDAAELDYKLSKFTLTLVLNL